MSRKARPTVVGIFVVGAVTIAVVAVLILGSGTFLRERYPFVMYFDGSIKGLNVGAPVVFRGVKVGAVTDIKMEFDPSDMSVRIPVFVEFHPERVTRVTGESDPRKNIKTLIAQGLRAQLEMQSLVTGMLMVSVDFHPDTPARLLGVEDGMTEVPTIPTTFQELSRTIENLKLDELVLKIFEAVETFNDFVSSPELAESIRSLNAALGDVQRLVQNVDRQVDPVAGHLTEVSKATSAVLEKATSTMSTLDGFVAEDGAPRYELVNVLEEISAAARSVRIIADFFERHPEALVHGKPGPKGKIK